jgi:hypothetical protein
VPLIPEPYSKSSSPGYSIQFQDYRRGVPVGDEAQRSPVIRIPGLQEPIDGDVSPATWAGMRAYGLDTGTYPVFLGPCVTRQRGYGLEVLEIP